MITRRQFLCRTCYGTCLAVVGATSLPRMALASTAESHRVLVLDILQERGGDKQQMFVVEIESGKILAKADLLGPNTNIAVSLKGDVVSVISARQSEGNGPWHDYVDFYSAS